MCLSLHLHKHIEGISTGKITAMFQFVNVRSKLFLFQSELKYSVVRHLFFWGVEGDILPLETIINIISSVAILTKNDPNDSTNIFSWNGTKKTPTIWLENGYSQCQNLFSTFAFFFSIPQVNDMYTLIVNTLCPLVCFWKSIYTGLYHKS